MLIIACRADILWESPTAEKSAISDSARTESQRNTFECARASTNKYDELHVSEWRKRVEGGADTEVVRTGTCDNDNNVIPFVIVSLKH